MVTITLVFLNNFFSPSKKQQQEYNWITKYCCVFRVCLGNSFRWYKNQSTKICNWKNFSSNFFLLLLLLLKKNYRFSVCLKNQKKIIFIFGKFLWFYVSIVCIQCVCVCVVCLQATNFSLFTLLRHYSIFFLIRPSPIEWKPISRTKTKQQQQQRRDVWWSPNIITSVIS